MELTKDNASIFVPDGSPEIEALQRVSHLGVGAHQDDLEIMAYHGIALCFRSPTSWFGGITCSDGSGSIRAGSYADYSEEEMRAERRREQNIAAQLGRYSVMVQLDYPSIEVKSPRNCTLNDDLVRLMKAIRPEVVYTHNPTDKHDTHIGVAVAVIDALRKMPFKERPSKVFGCEVWRGLDWMEDEDKIILDVSPYGNLASSLLSLYDTQISSGKRFDLATIGRRRANATYLSPLAEDKVDHACFAIDLTPLVKDDDLDLGDFVDSYLNRFCEDVRGKLREKLGY